MRGFRRCVALSPDVPKTLVDVIERGLDTDPSRRFPTCGDFAAALRGAEASGRQPKPTVPLVDATPPQAPANEYDPDRDPRVVERPINLDFDGAVVRGFPYGWFDSTYFVSNVSTEYSVAVIKRDPDAGRCLEMRAPRPCFDGFGSVMQRCPAAFLRGRTVRLTGELKSKDVDGWAGLWLRLDGSDVPNLFFDNMTGNPVRGTTDWRSYKVEVVVPKEAAWLNYGLVLRGGGIVWADSFRLLVWTGSDWVDV
jgi:hypothetical protein